MKALDYINIEKEELENEIGTEIEDINKEIKGLENKLKKEINLMIIKG